MKELDTDFQSRTPCGMYGHLHEVAAGAYPTVRACRDCGHRVDEDGFPIIPEQSGGTP